MYAFTEPLKSAWQHLHNALCSGLRNDYSIVPNLRFDTDSTALLDSNLLIGQTCGYPLVKFYRHDLVPLCVPVFRAIGCRDISYSSAIIVHADSTANSLDDCVGKTLVINGPDSNSGMNLLRSEVMQLSPENPFFSSTLISGTHADSVRAVVEKHADIAAIDCITFALMRDAFPELVEKVRVIGYTAFTTGLPLVTPRTRGETLPQKRIIDLLNDALTTMPAALRSALPIEVFKAVSIQDYQSIEKMEASAQKAGRSALNF